MEWEWIRIDMSALKTARQHSFWEVMSVLPYFDGPAVVEEEGKQLRIDTIFLKFPTMENAVVGAKAIQESAKLLPGFTSEYRHPVVKLFYSKPIPVKQYKRRQFKGRKNRKRR